MGKKGKGTGSFGSRRNKSHTLCRRYVFDDAATERARASLTLGLYGDDIANAFESDD